MQTATQHDTAKRLDVIQIMLAALVTARESISTEAMVFADCNALDNGTFDTDDQAVMDDYTAALKQIQDAIHAGMDSVEAGSKAMYREEFAAGVEAHIHALAERGAFDVSTLKPQRGAV